MAQYSEIEEQGKIMAVTDYIADGSDVWADGMSYWLCRTPSHSWGPCMELSEVKKKGYDEIKFSKHIQVGFSCKVWVIPSKANQTVTPNWNVLKCSKCKRVSTSFF